MGYADGLVAMAGDGDGDFHWLDTTSIGGTHATMVTGYVEDPAGNGIHHKVPNQAPGEARHEQRKAEFSRQSE